MGIFINFNYIILLLVLLCGLAAAEPMPEELPTAPLPETATEPEAAERIGMGMLYLSIAAGVFGGLVTAWCLIQQDRRRLSP